MAHAVTSPRSFWGLAGYAALLSCIQSALESVVQGWGSGDEIIGDLIKVTCSRSSACRMADNLLEQIVMHPIASRSRGDCTTQAVKTLDQKRCPRRLFCFRLPSRIGRRFLSETLANGFGRANVDADAFLPRCSCPCEAMP